MVDHPTGCDDHDCELHNADVAIAEEVWDDNAKAFFLAGWHACLNYTSGSIDAWCDELTKAQFRLLRIRVPNFDSKFPQS
jgi:hypothetical protein